MDAIVREQLLALLLGENAHMNFDHAVADFPPGAFNRPVPGQPYTPWQLLEHIRLSQWDILDFIRNPHYVTPKFPDDYWPSASDATAAQWAAALARFHADLRALAAIVQDSATDLYADLPHAPGYNVLREILVVADHNAYHLGELAFIKSLLTHG